MYLHLVVTVGESLDKRVIDQLHQNRIKIENRRFKEFYSEGESNEV